MLLYLLTIRQRLFWERTFNFGPSSTIRFPRPSVAGLVPYQQLRTENNNDFHCPCRKNSYDSHWLCLFILIINIISLFLLFVIVLKAIHKYSLVTDCSRLFYSLLYLATSKH